MGLYGCCNTPLHKTQHTLLALTSVHSHTVKHDAAKFMSTNTSCCSPSAPDASSARFASCSRLTGWPLPLPLPLLLLLRPPPVDDARSITSTVGAEGAAGGLGEAPPDAAAAACCAERAVTMPAEPAPGTIGFTPSGHVTTTHFCAWL